MTATVRPITASATHDLRRAVLRGGDPDAEVVFQGDDEPTTFHLGVHHRDRLVGVATVLRRPQPVHPGPAAQLRGMAVAPEQQGTGVGRMLLEAAVERLRHEGVPVLWANARDTALRFYERAGMRVVGEGFVTPEVGLPHHLVVLEL